MDWKHLLAFITGTVDQELLLRNEYLVTENRILRNHITGRVRLTDGERKTLADIGSKLGKRAPFSRGRLRWPGCRGGAGAYKAASRRKRVTIVTGWGQARQAARNASAA